MSLNESIVEEASLSWFSDLGYTVGHGLMPVAGKFIRFFRITAADLPEVRGPDGPAHGRFHALLGLLALSALSRSTQ